MTTYTLPDVPASLPQTAEAQQALAWDVLFDWCVGHGLLRHSFDNQERYRKLLGPQMVAQWILDIQSGKATISDVDIGWKATIEHTESTD